MNIANITAKTLARINSAKPMSREYGEAIAQAWVEATTPVVAKVAKAAAIDVSAGQLMRLNGGEFVRVIRVSSNGVWIRRTATRAEREARGLDYLRGEDMIKRRVSKSALTAY